MSTDVRSLEKAEEAVGLAIQDVLAVAGQLGAAALSERIRTSNLNYDVLRSELRFLSANVTKLEKNFNTFRTDLRAWAKKIENDIQALQEMKSSSAVQTGHKSGLEPVAEENWD